MRKPLLHSIDEGTKRDLTGLDGCEWVVELNADTESSERLEPTSLVDSNKLLAPVLKKIHFALTLRFKNNDRSR